MIRRFVFLPLLLAAAIGGMISSTASAQYNTAEISGIVRDAQGGALPGATVVATHLPSGQKTTRISDGSGRFLLPALIVGPYVIVVELQGFKRFVHEGLVLAVGQRIELPITGRFDARNYFDDPLKTVPRLRQNNFGANVGGPLSHDRSFFFFSYEGQRQDRALTQTFSVPSAALRSGDFSGLPALCDPTTRTATGCSPFSGNGIPASRLDPVALALLAKVPLPTAPADVQNLLAVDQEADSMNQFSLRLDHRLRASDSLYGRLTTYRVRADQPFGTSQLNETLVPGFGRTVTTRSTNVAIGHTHTFGARVLNEIRFGYLSAAGGQGSPNAGVNLAASSGLQGVTADPRDSGYPQMSFGGRFSTIGDPTSFVSRDNRSFELYENVLVDRGAHRLKLGAYMFHLNFNPVNPNMAHGAFTFTGQWTGDAFADFLLGYPSVAQVGLGRADEHGRTTWLHLYGQDGWEIRPNLALNVGLRYEINGQMNDVDNRLSAVDLSVPAAGS
jgi:hypothetical protein